MRVEVMVEVMVEERVEEKVGATEGGDEKLEGEGGREDEEKEDEGGREDEGGEEGGDEGRGGRGSLSGDRPTSNADTRFKMERATDVCRQHDKRAQARPA